MNGEQRKLCQKKTTRPDSSTTFDVQSARCHGLWIVRGQRMNLQPDWADSWKLTDSCSMCDTCVHTTMHKLENP